MGTIQARYDAAAGRYRTWWAPVLAPAGLGLFDVVGAARPTRILDIGAGTGLLAIEAVRRWPSAAVIGLDDSTGMLEVAATEAGRRLSSAERGRLELVTGNAARLPFGDRSFDLVLSSFVLQLVPNRSAVLREARRVLRPGGQVAFVTWLVASADARFAPDEAFDQALDELDISDEGEPEEARSGDFPSAPAAGAQLRRAGFRGVRAWAATLEHRFEPGRYVAFLEEYAEREVFEDLDEPTRRRLRDRTAGRLGRLGADAFIWRAPIVYAAGRSPG